MRQDSSLTIPGTCVIVLGMGRSGTSFLTAVLASLGADLGPELIPASEANPRGFFEHAEIVRFHQAVLKRVRNRPDWDDTAGELLSENDLSDQDRECAAGIVESLARNGLWGWKDPRTIHFIRFWLSLLPDAKIVVPLRHPLEIVYSYLKRVGGIDFLTDPDKVLRAYIAYHDRIASVVASRTNHALVIYAQNAFSDAGRLAARIREFLGVPILNGAHPAGFESAEFSRCRLDRGAVDLFEAAYPAAAALFKTLNERAQFAFSTGDSADPAVANCVQAAREMRSTAWLPILIDLCRPYGSPCYFEMQARRFERFAERADFLLKQTQSLQSALDEHVRIIRSQAAQISELQHSGSEFQAAKDFWHEQAELRQTAHQEMAAQLQQAKQFWHEQAEARQKALDEHAALVAQQTAVLEQQSTTIKQLNEASEALRQENEALRQENEALRQENEALRREQDVLLRSFSWRSTSWLRRFGSLIKNSS